MSSAIDVPAWIGAWSAIAGVLASIIALVVSLRAKSSAQKVAQDYAIISSEGIVLRHRGFGEFGLRVKLDIVAVSPDRSDVLVPEYTLMFDRQPDYFEATTMEGAVVIIKQDGTKSYKLRFVAAGFGDPVVKSCFKLQAY